MVDLLRHAFPGILIGRSLFSSYLLMKFDTTSKLLISLVICTLAGGIGSFFTASSVSTWYATLEKPALNPPSWVFAPVWTILYLMMSFSLFLVWKNNWKIQYPLITKKWGKAWNPYSQRLWTGSWQTANVISIFGIQLGLNTLWSVLFFGMQTPGFAFFELLALWCAIIYTIINFYRISKPAAYLLIPYLLWVSFAGYLNFMIWMLNA